MQKEVKRKARTYGVVAVLLALILGVLCYNLGVLPASKTSPAPMSGQTNTFSSAVAPLAIPIDVDLLVYAYGGETEGFVQASVTLTGPELNGTAIQIPTSPLLNGTTTQNQTNLLNGSYYVTISEEYFNGTTTTDVQNPLTFLRLYPGVYSLSATYGTAPPQNITLNMTEWSGWYQTIFNFGSTPPPPMGHLIIEAFAETNGIGMFVPASVTITGPESFNATIIGSDNPPSVFTVAPGAYTITATYASFPQQTDTATVTDGGFAGAIFWLYSNPSG